MLCVHEDVSSYPSDDTSRLGMWRRTETRRIKGFELWWLWLETKNDIREVGVYETQNPQHTHPKQIAQLQHIWDTALEIAHDSYHALMIANSFTYTVNYYHLLQIYAMLNHLKKCVHCFDNSKSYHNRVLTKYWPIDYSSGTFPP